MGRPTEDTQLRSRLALSFLLTLALAAGAFLSVGDASRPTSLSQQLRRINLRRSGFHSIASVTNGAPLPDSTLSNVPTTPVFVQQQQNWARSTESNCGPKNSTEKSTWRCQINRSG